MRPIDADKLEYKEVIEPMRDRDGMIYPLHYLVVKKTDILCAPTLDVAPVTHGEWFEVEVIDDDEPFGVTDSAQCSECGFDAYVGVYWANDNYLYCPNCGAKMDGRKVDDLS